MKELACLLADRCDPFTETLLLELTEGFHAVRLLSRGDEIPPHAFLLVDLDYATAPPARGNTVGYSRTPRKSHLPTLARPFPMAALRRFFASGGVPFIPDEDFRTVFYEGEAISLTVKEAALFRLLYEAQGTPVARDVLEAALFPLAKTAGALTVYIHYLRKKLERNKRRLIHAHRGGGYSLSLE